MAEIEFIRKIHTRTPRNYLERVTGADKAECAAIAKQFGREFWDGDRKHGYGGHYYDGRWREMVREMARHYQIKPGNACR